MEKNVLQAIDGVQIYPIISLIIFVLFFAGVIFWMIKADRDYLVKMSRIPLTEEPDAQEDVNFENNKILKG